MEARVDQVGDDEPDERRARGAQGAGAGVGPVPERGRGRPDPGRGLGADPGRAVQRPRGSTDRHPAAPGHLPEIDCHGAKTFPHRPLAPLPRLAPTTSALSAVLVAMTTRTADKDAIWC